MKRLRHPIRAIREPFGKAGLIVAVVALVAALGGSAIAAKGALTHKQKKEVAKIAKKEAKKFAKAGAEGKQGPVGPVGAAGAQGPAGAAGKDGTNGEKGDTGNPGKSVVLSETASNCAEGGITVEVEGSPAGAKEVCNGEEGEPGEPGAIHPGETLPPGATETGGWSLISPVPPYEGFTAISFNIPLGEELSDGQVHFVTKAEIENESNADCTGTVAAPVAPPGELCVYEKSAAFVEEFEIEKLSGGAGASTAGAKIFAYLEEGGGSSSGTGSWAVTGCTAATGQAFQCP